MSAAPTYTVALCTHNHAGRLVRTLAELPAIRAPDQAWELLIVDNASSDGTADMLARHAWPEDWLVRRVREERLGIAHARNRAIAESRGEFLIFMDDDETPDPDWLRAIECVIRENKPDAVGGRISVLFEDPRPAWLTNELLGFLGQLDWGGQTRRLEDPATPLFTGNFCVRTEICRELGGFDVTLGRVGSANFGGEDVDFYRRLLQSGYSIWWAPTAVIHHRIEATKLRRSYFLDLHYRQGMVEGARARGSRSRVPPKYLWPQAARAFVRAAWRRVSRGASHSLRLEMNAVYFAGYLRGWSNGAR